MNPVMRVIYGLLGLGMLGVMLTLGVMFFVVFAAIALIGGSIVAARIWWLSRKVEKQFGGSFEKMRESVAQTSHRPTDETVLDGEYTVVEPQDRP